MIPECLDDFGFHRLVVPLSSVLPVIVVAVLCILDTDSFLALIEPAAHAPVHESTPEPAPMPTPVFS